MTNASWADIMRRETSSAMDGGPGPFPADVPGNADAGAAALLSRAVIAGGRAAGGTERAIGIKLRCILGPARQHAAHDQRGADDGQAYKIPHSKSPPSCPETGPAGIDVYSLHWRGGPPTANPQQRAAGGHRP